MNAKEFSKVFRRLAKAPSRANSAIATDINAEIQRNFDRGLDANRKPFKKLSKAYAERRKFKSKPILTQTERGRNSVKVIGTNAGLKARIGVDYMVIHQKGGPIMPRRAPLPTGKMPKAWNEIALHRIDEVVSRELK